MPEIFYKYTSHINVDNILDMAVRLSPPSILNDPFEIRLNSNVIKSLIKHDKLNFIFESDSELFKAVESVIGKEESAQNYLNATLNMVGVVSLSKSPTNLLMWSHYANEHKGVCIGFKPNFIGSVMSNAHGIIDTRPIRVKYRKKRPNPTTFSNKENAAGGVMHHHLTTKSIDWKYEQEYRSLVPIEGADKIKIKNDAEYKGFIEYILSSEAKLNSDGEYYSGAIPETIITRLAKNAKDVIFLKSISMDNVVSIHLGCKFDSCDEIFLINQLKKNGIGWIKVYKCKKSDVDFNLDTVEIYPNELGRKKYNSIEDYFTPE